MAQSVIGRNCHIGKAAVVVGSYLLEGVRIHNGAQVSSSTPQDNVQDLFHRGFTHAACDLGTNVKVEGPLSMSFSLSEYGTLVGQDV